MRVTITQNAGIIGETVNLNLAHLGDVRQSSLLYNLTHRLMALTYRNSDGSLPLHLFGQFKRVTKIWLDGYLICKGDTYPALLMNQELSAMACERISSGITSHFLKTARSKRCWTPTTQPAPATMCASTPRKLTFGTAKARRPGARSTGWC